MKRFRPCMCPSCATPQEREMLAAAEAYDREINEIAFEAYLADRADGRPRVAAYYRHLAEQAYVEVRKEEAPVGSNP